MHITHGILRIVGSIVCLMVYKPSTEIEPNFSEYKKQATISCLDIHRVTKGCAKWIDLLFEDLPTHFGAY